LAENANPKLDGMVVSNIRQYRANAAVHPSWLRLMNYCAELGHGEIEKLKIQDGLPMVAEVTMKKVKFSP
jgi:hypothetical protein